MAQFNRYTYLATSGDRVVKAAGEEVYLPSGRLNVYTGELVVFNPKTNLTVAAASVLTQDRVSIAVGVGKEGQMADSLRFLAGEEFNLCTAKLSALATPPQCAAPEAQDVFFDCTKCDENYAIQVGLDDSLVRSRYNVNERAKYIYTAQTECGGCDDCETDVPCVEVRDQIVKQLNFNFSDNPTDHVWFQRRRAEQQYQPFRALPLYNAANSLKEYCFDLGDADCDTCTLVAGGIGGISIGGEVTEFVGTVDANGDTLVGQMPAVIEQIKEALSAAGVGDAHMTYGLHGCCPYCIQISSSAAIILLDGAGVDPVDNLIAPSVQSNPFTVHGTSLTCGFRLVADPITVECLCDWPANLPVPNYYGRTLDVQKIGEGWVKDNFEVYKAGDQVLPEGFGYFYQDRERYQHNGGQGRDYRYSNRKVGIIGLPDSASRDSNTTIACNRTYCVYNILSTATKNLRFNNAFSVSNTDASFILIPSADTTTRTSWETYLTELVKLGLCEDSVVSCTQD